MIFKSAILSALKFIQYPGVTTRFHYDDKERLIRESDTNNNTIAQYMYDDNDQLQAIEKGGAIYYTHYNYRGDIQGLTDATGQKIAWYSYTPWKNGMVRVG